MARISPWSAQRIGNGMLMQLANALAARISLPLPGLSAAPIGALFDTTDTDAQAGADLIDSIISPRKTVGAHADAGAVLRQATVRSDGSHAVQLTLQVQAGDVDWGKQHAASELLAVYVDGRYHSSIVVMSERPQGYVVNLGRLTVGDHKIELRSTGPAPTTGQPTGVSVTSITARTQTALQDEIARHAPVLEYPAPETAPMGRSPERTDAPLLLVPSVRHEADGGRTLEYRVLFSNEDGGTAIESLLNTYGRSTDYELLYTVRLDGAGKVLGRRYQGPMHVWHSAGIADGGRMVLRIATTNNLTSSRTSPQPWMRWSEAPVAPVLPTASDAEVMRAHPWTYTVMAKELARERTGRDLRRYVFLTARNDAAAAALVRDGQVTLVLRDGTRITVPVIAGAATGGGRSTAVELPAGAAIDAVVGVATLELDGMMLDANMQPRQLAAA